MRLGPFLLVGVPLLTCLGLNLFSGARPNPEFQLLAGALGLLAVLLSIPAYFWHKRHNPQSVFVGWFLFPLLLVLIGPQVAMNLGYQVRPALFTRDLPQLNQAVSLFKENKLTLKMPDKGTPAPYRETTATLPRTLSRLPKTVTIQGESGHRQLVFIMGGYFMTAFYAYIWCEDGKPPTQALRYSIDASDHVTPRGDGWFEAVVNNGH